MTPISFFAWSHQRSHRKKRHPHHHRNHVVSTSTAAAALSSAKVLMSHSNTAPSRHAPEQRYHADLAASAISSSTAANTRPGTSSLVPSSTTAQSQDRSSPTCTSPSQLAVLIVTYVIPSSPEDNDIVANQAHQLLICKSTSTHHDVITTINCYGKQLHNHLYPCLILIFICL